MKVVEVRPVKKKGSKPRAFLLFSGGLDSALAGLVLQKAGVEVLPITFKSPFFGYDQALKIAEQLDWPLVVVDITEKQLEIVEKPKYGYGKNMNPCIDCHAQMLRIACSLRERYDVDFLATGEVLNERPKSQNRKALDIVAEESGCKDIVLRPLSAKLLPPTEPEKKGLVSREMLLDISGRSRKRQIELAQVFGLKDFPSPAGGCLLTDPVFSGRLRKLLSWRGYLDIRDIELVKYGRSFFEENFWIVVSRNERETKIIESLADTGDVKITTADVPGPVAVVRFKKKSDDELLRKKAVRLASLLTIRYSKARDRATAFVKIIEGGSERLEKFSREEWQPLLDQPYIPQF